MKILFYSINGLGLGHLSRTVTIAKEIKEINPKADIFFFTKSDNTYFLEKEGIPFFKAPAMGIGEDSGIFIETVMKYQPDIIVYDNFFPHEGLKFAHSNGIRNVLVLRKKRKGFLENEFESYGDIYTLFDSFIVAENEKGFEIQIPSKLKDRFIFTGPIIRSIKPSKKQNNHSISKKEFHICATCGGGGYKETDEFLKTILETQKKARNKVKKLKFTVITGPYYKKDIKKRKIEGVVIREFEPDIIGLMESCDMIISRAGYNTVNEIMSLRKPSILVPVETKEDCQLERAKDVESKGLGWCLDTHDKNAMSKIILDFYSKKQLSDKIEKNFKKVKIEKGNKAAATTILKLMDLESETTKKNLKVCMISSNYPPFKEGMGFAVNRIAKNLARNGIEIHVVTRRPDDGLSDLMDIETSVEDGIFVHRIMDNEFGKYHNSSYEINRIMHFLKRLHDTYSFDVFQGFGIFPCGFISTLISRMTGVPNIVSVRGYWGEIGILDNRYIKSIMWTIDNATSVTFVSESARNKMEHFAKCKHKSEVIYNSLDPGLFLFDESRKLNLAGFKIGIVGMMREKKGWDYLIKAFSKLQKEHSESNLVLIGFFEKGYVPKVDEKPDNVTITGFVDRKYVLNYINQMDVVIIPSVSDGCPNVLFESMYCKKPVIGSKVGAIPEIIRDGENGLLVDPCSAEGIYSKLKTLLNDAKLRERLGINGYRTVKEKFTPENETEQWIAIYKKMGSEGDAVPAKD
jgi:glycosyltransferase involved in cell wall biosynthesis/predicted glycosyltransferase